MKFTFLLLFFIFHFVNSKILDCVFVIDSSASIGHKKFKRIKNTIKNTANELIDLKLDYNSSFSLINFGHKIKLYNTQDDDIFFKKLDVAKSFDSGASIISSAFKIINEKVFNSPVLNNTRRVILIFTDGNPRPAKLYGGPQIIKQINETINDRGLSKLIYFEVNKNNSKLKSNSNQFVKIGNFYNKSTDHLDFSFEKNTSENLNKDLVIKILGFNPYLNSPTNSPSASPSASPTNLPTISPTFSPTNSLTNLPTFSPTFSPTNLPTFSPTSSSVLAQCDDEINGKVYWSLWPIALIICSIISFFIGRYCCIPEKEEAFIDNKEDDTDDTGYPGDIETVENVDELFEVEEVIEVTETQLTEINLSDSDEDTNSEL